MTELFESLKKECAEAGTNLTEVCKEAEVDRGVPERWRYKEPKSLEILGKLRAVIERKKQEKTK